MAPDNHLDDALRSLAGHAARTGRLAGSADIRRRGDTRRKRRHAATAALGVAVVGLLTAGIVATRPDGGPQPGPLPPADTPAPATNDPILSGKRQVTIVRVGGFESGVSLTDSGKLDEVVDDSGRQLFVLTPLGGEDYLVRTAEPGPGGEPSCWQAKANGSKPLTVVGAACSTTDPLQRFTVTRQGRSGSRPAYAIANNGAYLRYASKNGLILEELGDGNRIMTFQLIDNGVAPSPGR
jgi:hypothetical protein